MRKQLDEILVYLDTIDYPLRDKLCPSLSKKDICQLFTKIGIKVPHELISLYQWKNGVNTNSDIYLDDIHLFPGFYFLKLEDAIQNYLLFTEHSYWNPSWFPIFANGGGDFYAIDFSIKIDDKHPIIGFILGAEIQEIEFDNLETMIKIYHEAYKKEIIFKTPEGYLELTDECFEKLLKDNDTKTHYNNIGKIF